MSIDMQTLASMKSWVEYSNDTDFPIQNLPYGVFTTSTITNAHIGVAIGAFILDLFTLAQNGYFSDSSLLQGGDVFKHSTLNELMSLGKDAWAEARRLITDVLLLDGNSFVSGNAELKEKVLVSRETATMHVPARIGDYTDFYASRNHAYNVGVMFRGPDNALQPNWTWLPVGYHGRASSVVVSGTPLHRPQGQLTPPNNLPPAVHEPCKNLDFELELGFFVGPGNKLGQPMTTEEAADNIFGVVLLNDWSARDIQKWEYVPLGPFGAKNFGTTISPWIVTTAALAPFAIQNQEQDPKPLEYLQETGSRAYNIELDVYLKPHDGVEKKIVSSNSKYLYWTFSQMLAHHTVTGCNMNAGDLLGSGTISGTQEEEYGSLLELTWKGSKTVDMGDGVTRKFIQDGDSINMRGTARGNGFNVGFGDCEGTILPVYKK